MFTFFGCAIQTVSLVLVLCAIQSASHTPEESLSRLKSSDNCYDEGLHFCIHANGMCYGPREYCPKDGEGKVRQCLPGDEKEALELCKKFLEKEEDLPHSQCEWACESKFDDNQLSFERTCPSPWEHICPANGKCYGPQHFCDEKSRKIKACLPENERDAGQRCEQIKNGGDFPHPQCEWACESRFKGIRHSGSGSSESHSLIAVLIFLGFFWLLSNILIPIVLWKKGKLSELFCFCRDQRENNNTLTCWNITFTLLLVLPFATAIAMILMDTDKKDNETQTDPDGVVLTNNGVDDSIDNTSSNRHDSASHSRNSPNHQNSNPGRPESRPQHQVSDEAGHAENMQDEKHNGTQTDADGVCLTNKGVDNSIDNTSSNRHDSASDSKSKIKGWKCATITSSDSGNPPNHRNTNTDRPGSGPQHQVSDESGTQPISPPPASSVENMQDKKDNETQTDPDGVVLTNNGVDDSIDNTSSNRHDFASHSRNSPNHQNSNPGRPGSGPQHQVSDEAGHAGNRQESNTTTGLSNHLSEDTDDDGAKANETTSLLARQGGQEDHGNGGASQMNVGDGTRANALIHSGKSKIEEGSDFQESERQRNNRNIDDVGVQPKIPSPRSSTSDHACGAACTVQVDVHH